MINCDCNDTEPVRFVAHGLYTISNSLGCEVQLCKCGETARTRYTKYDGTKIVSNWREIIDDVDEDGEDQKVISEGDCGKIPLDLVMRVPYGWNKDENYTSYWDKVWRWDEQY